MPDQIRLLVVEDVPQVAQYIRGLLNSQQAIKLLDVVSDGSKVARPDLRAAPRRRPRRRPAPGPGQGHEPRRPASTSRARGVPVIVLTVPQQPVVVDPGNGVHGVLVMPFTGYELVTRLQQVHQASQVAATTRTSPG